MLRNVGIRSKILAVLALPVLALVLAASVVAGGSVGDARAAGQVERLAAQAPGLTQLTRGLQAERSLSLAVLAGDTASAAQLADVRAKVDEGLRSVRSEVASNDLSRLDDAARDAVAASEGAHTQLPSIRSQMDAGALTAEFVAGSYAAVIDADVALPERIADAVDDRELANQLRAYSAIERLAESIAQEIDLATSGIAAGRYSAALRTQLTNQMAEQDAARSVATGAAKRFGVHVPTTGYPMELARARTIGDADGAPAGITGTEFRAAGQADVDALKGSETKLARLAGDRSAELSTDAAGRALLVGAVAVLLVVFPLLLALLIAHRITSPLRRLTEAAGHLRSELPSMVERMHAPGEGPDLGPADIPVESTDEIGRLAAAFNDVNATTVQVAQEQAALRGSIAAMFVNVARRDQVLLSRQLAFIDQLERAEENPATLESLFKLDHLATRMRRNAESLLVLAGIDTGRRLRRPMPLSDVIRTAASEIEHYERIDLALRVDPPMVGHIALSAAHLLAELLENATRFSDPGSRVVVSTGSNETGIVVTVADEGLGMSADEIADATARIAEPAVTEVVGAQRLGFFVVGRLARKLDATVSLTAGRTTGTVVTVVLPPALFVPGSVVSGGDDDQVEDDDGTLTSLPDTADDGHELPQPSEPSAVAPMAPQAVAAAPCVPEPVEPVVPEPVEPVVPEPVEPVAPEPALPALVTAAVTILPGSGRNRSFRRGRKAGSDAPQPVQAVTRRELPGSGNGQDTAEAHAAASPGPAVPTASTEPAATATPFGAPAPMTPPVPARDTVPTALAPAPSGLFAPHVASSSTALPTRTPGVTHPGTLAPAAAAPPAPAPSAQATQAAQAAQAAPIMPPPSLFGTTSATSEPEPVSHGGLAERSALASEALTELSLLSSYSPSSVEPRPASTLSRRSPAATPAAVPAPRPGSAPNRRARNASDVRSMLSGFQAGVARGRTAPEGTPAESETPE